MPELDAIVRAANPLADDEVVRAHAVEALSELLDAGLIIVGIVTRTTGFEPTTESTSQVLQRVDREWKVLRVPFVPGEICWVGLTERGRAEGQRIFDARPAPE